MEKLMQYLWQHRLLRPGRLSTVDNRKVDVIDPGQLNTGSGPDFFNAKIYIDGRLWAGDVEIHVNASDWFRHGHDQDQAYDSVILHVVDCDDMPVYRTNGELIPQMRLPAAPDFATRYADIVNRADMGLPCAEFCKDLPDIYIHDWLAALGTERIHHKSERIMELHRAYGGDWRMVAYVVLARALGFGTNAQPMELLARGTPYGIMAKHGDNPTTIEAILFGQSGLLDGAPSTDGYVQRLRSEYEFMRTKFGLRQPSALNWKMGRMRPQNFPHRRIALLAQMVCHMYSVFNGLMDATDADEAMDALKLPLNGYWASHFTFKHTDAYAPEDLESHVGVSTLRALIINAAVPLSYAYRTHRGDDTAMDRAMDMLMQLPAENNSIVTLFKERAGIKCPDAFTSQALIELRRNYCEARKCLFCRLGHRLLSTKATRPDPTLRSF